MTIIGEIMTKKMKERFTPEEIEILENNQI